MRGKYIMITLAITCCTGVASWRAASQISLRIQAATHLPAMAQLNAQEKARAAEIAMGVSEAAERFAREELALERKTREAAERALDKALNRTVQTARTLAEQDTKSFEGNSPDAEITKEELVLTLAMQEPTNKAMKSKLKDLDAVLLSLDEMIAKQVAARRRTQTELENAKDQLRDLSSQLQQTRTTKPRTTHVEKQIALRSSSRRRPIWWRSALQDR
jgi:hypothetical protein